MKLFDINYKSPPYFDFEARERDIPRKKFKGSP